MNKLKEYIKKKKVDNKFKSLGQGYVLSSGAPASASSSASAGPPTAESSAEARARAAAAVEKRLNQNTSKMTFSQKAVYMQAKRELDEEQRQLARQVDRVGLGTATTNSSEPLAEQKEDDSTVLYTCDLLDELALPKAEIFEAIETFLRAQLDGDEALDSSILMICSLNKFAKMTAAVETIQKYLGNIIGNPNEPKFRRIRKSNKVFQEKIASTKGAEEFLKAVGFRHEEVATESGGSDTFLVMAEERANRGELENALQELQNGNSVTLKLFRDPKVFTIDPTRAIPAPVLPPDFYRLSAGELKSMQEARTKEVERLTTLRTGKMREMEAGASASSLYKYSLIRVRFPNNFVLQGMFNVCESVFAVRQFVYNQLEFEEGEFVLSLPSAGRIVLNDEKTLAESGLVSTALIHFDWTDETLAHFAQMQCRPTYLAQNLERRAEALA